MVSHGHRYILFLLINLLVSQTNNGVSTKILYGKAEKAANPVPLTLMFKYRVPFVTIIITNSLGKGATNKMM